MRNASKTLSLSTTITVCNRTSPLKSGNPTLSVALLALFGAGMHAFQPRPTENDLCPTHLHRLVTSLQSGGPDIAPGSGVLSPRNLRRASRPGRRVINRSSPAPKPGPAREARATAKGSAMLNELRPQADQPGAQPTASSEHEYNWGILQPDPALARRLSIPAKDISSRLKHSSQCMARRRCR